MAIDKSWMQKSRVSSEYHKGVLEFLDFAFSNAPGKEMLPCPCIRCNNCLMQKREIMYDHLLDNGIARNYVRWLMHGEYEFCEPTNTSTNESNMHDEMQEMLNDAFRMPMPNEESERSPHVHGDNKSFTMLLELLKEAFPEDCMLYSKEHANANECVVCGVSRWKSSDDHSTDEFTNSAKKKKIPAKTLLAWKNFDNVHPSLALEPRNVRLGLASDGFNPFGNMSISYSMWPVVLIPYNLPPWMCMKQTFFMLSLLIPGPTAPGNDIDIYLQPLIDELNDLWDVGVETYDASTKKFCMRAAILWTINDFPAYANLSGWSTKGNLLVLFVIRIVLHFGLQNGRKWCYMGHRRFLPIDHRFRRDKKSFDGNEEHRAAPKQLSGEDILHQLDGMEHITLGKTSKNKMSAKRKREHVELEHNWKKKSIFFQLPYWKTLILRHNLDVMHIEKNICDSIVGTLLSIDGKSKDNFNSRLDLQAMGIRDQLHPIQRGNRVILPAACYSLTSNEKKEFCKFLKEVKVPDGYASNISRCVQVNERKIFGLKSHDCHVLMQQLFHLQFEEFYIRMYLRTLKSYVRNKSRPEGSIAEGYIAEECTTFCSRYLHDVETKHDREERNYVIENNITNGGGLTIFKCMGRTIGKSTSRVLSTEEWSQAHLYVLTNCEEVTSFIEEHKQSIRVKPRIRARDVDLIHTREFISWFEERISHKRTRKGKKTQNSGVVVTAEVSSFASARDKNPIPGHVSYYGVLTDVIELHYLGGNRVILFKCDWWDVINSGRGIKKDEYGFTCLNFERTICTDEPFVLASQAKQVFYVQNSNEENWHTVVEIQTRGVYDMNQKVSTNDPEPYQQLITLHSQRDEMSHRRGRVQIVSPEDELDNLQLLDIQPAATTTPSSSDPSDSSDPSVVGSSSSKKRTRGPTRNLDLLSMKPGEKKTTRFNTEGKLFMMEKGKDLSSYMGTLVRSQHNVPIQVQDWNHVSEDVKEKIWALVLEKYELEETCKSYILQCCGNLFRSYRNKMKAKYYNPYNTDEERLCHRPPHLSDDDWRWLIHFWGTPEAKDISEKNKANRAKQVIKHTSGSKSYAQIRYEQDQFQQLLSQPEGHLLLLLHHLEHLHLEHGRVRGYGFGPTPTLVFGSTSRRRSGAILSTQLENAQEMLIAAEQKFTTATEELSM
ncbi:hypothetical protein CK203_028978 [Vitis vinifera]|uniref:Transposase-associated domain-containing protein n=1 Tax=Vitis vinifera TaxID=29760 RepID=A0A438IMS4_VITVI|nr:hypothetical protein CK203_028978 [Vitis vinifera]